jgi:hypothetical protein
MSAGDGEPLPVTVLMSFIHSLKHCDATGRPLARTTVTVTLMMITDEDKARAR